MVISSIFNTFATRLPNYWPGYLVLFLLLITSCGGGSSGIANNGSTSDQSAGLVASPVPNTSSCAESISITRITSPTLMQNFASDCDYFINGRITISSDLTIEPGTTIIMGKDSNIAVVEGRLIAVGNAENRITVRGEAALSGYWDGINFINSRPSRLEYVDIVDAGQEFGFSGADAALQVSVAAISLIDVSVSNSYVYGVELSSSAQLTAFANNRFFGNQKAGLLVDQLLIPELDSETDYYGISEPNGEPVVKVDSTIRDYGKVTWPSLNAPYSATTLYVHRGSEITLAPGTHIAIDQSGFLPKLDVSRNSKLIARGAPDAPIIFSAAPGFDSWPQMEISSDASVEFDHVIFKQAEQGINLQASPNLSVSNTRFEDMDGYMIDCVEFFNSLGTPTITIGENVAFPDTADGLIGPDCP